MSLKQDPLTYQQRELFEIIIYVFSCTFISLFGIVANSINIIVFCRQGFSSTVNISLCGLAISDLCSLTLQLWFNLCSNPLFKNAGIPFDPSEILYLTCGAPIVCFGRITSWITVFVTAERCLGIAAPLKVKDIITGKRTAIAIVSIYCFNVLSIAPIYPNYYFGGKFFPEKNRTLVGLITVNGDIENAINSLGFMLSFFIGLLSFVAVIVFTVILVVKLGQTSAWRKKATMSNEKSESMSTRDKKTVKMIILIASILIVCYTPGTSFPMVTILFVPEFTIFGAYRNTYYSVWSFSYLLQNLNSSVNIFLYYSMSTNYRQTFQQLFSLCGKVKNKMKPDFGENNMKEM